METGRYRKRIVFSWIVMLVGVAVVSKLEIPLGFVIVGLPIWFARHVVRPVFPQGSDRESIIVLSALILWIASIHFLPEAVRNIVMTVIFLAGFAWVVRVDLHLFRHGTWPRIAKAEIRPSMEDDTT